jgi:Polyketide cyclase / dehydrase and lipid transport
VSRSTRPPPPPDCHVLRRLLVFASVAVPLTWLFDRWLAAKGDRIGVPAPLEMLAVVDAPIDTTWAVVVDIPRQVEWMREMKAVSVDTPGPVRVGTRARATVRILGIPVTDPVAITQLVPPTRYAIRHLGLFVGDGLITLESGADGTTTIVRWRERLVPPVLPALGAVIQAPILRPIFQADLLRLKRLVEAGHA